MTTLLAPLPAPARTAPTAAVLIRRVNQLYHALTQDSFDRDHRHRHHAERRLWQSVAALLRQHSSSSARTVADIGCGTGFVTTLLGAALHPEDRLLAIDVTEAALHTTTAKWRAAGLQEHGPRLRCLLSDVQALPLADAALDVVTINAALHHLPAPEAALAEIHRVLRPGGLFALGFEPNQGHFQSPLLRHLAHGLDRACWYASLRQNRRRLRQWLVPAGAAQPAPWLAPLNAALLDEGLIDAPLTERRLFELVDPHACGAPTVAGFDPPALIQRFFPGYEVQLLKYTDYLGESARRLPLARAAADRLLGAMAAGRGSLFSWLLRKPIVAPTGDVTDICPWEAT